jgi:hypothetical protein
MNERLTCDLVHERELVERYAAGTSPEHEAESLEQHVLECQACWEELLQAVEIRAALRAQAPAAGSSDRWTSSTRQSNAASWRKVAIAALAAAALALIVVPVWQRGREEPTDSVTRGATALEIHPTWELTGDLRVDWTQVDSATLYRVRVRGRTGSPVLRQATAPPITVPSSVLAGLGELLVDVEAENAVGEVIANGPAAVVPPR